MNNENDPQTGAPKDPVTHPDVPDTPHPAEPEGAPDPPPPPGKSDEPPPAFPEGVPKRGVLRKDVSLKSRQQSAITHDLVSREKKRPEKNSPAFLLTTENRPLTIRQSPFLSQLSSRV